MGLPAELDFQLNPAASPARMNLATASIDNRLKALEAYKPNFDALYAQLQQIGLERISEALAPVFEALLGVADLGSVFTTSSSTPNTVGLGAVTFAVAAGDKPKFAPSGYMIAVSAMDSRNAMSGRVSNYDRATGFLTMDISVASGTGSHADWRIMPTVPPLTALTGIDGGSDDAPDFEAVPYVASDALSTETTDYDAGIDGVNTNIPPVLFDNGTA